jgi:hypothetical protein
LERLVGHEAAWYTMAVWVSCDWRRKLYPRDAPNLETALHHTAVYVGRSDMALARFNQTHSRDDSACDEAFPRFREYERERARELKRKGGRVSRIVWLGDATKPHLPLTPIYVGDVGRNKACAERQTLEGLMRRAVKEQISEFKRSAFSGGRAAACSLCGKCVAARAAHIDHGAGQLAFASIKERFLRGCGGGAAAHHTRAFRASPGRVGRWQEFHREHARLLVTCAKCNLEQGRG